RQSPETGCALVVRVERAAREDECEAEERRRDEPGTEIGERRRRRQPSGDERPPEEEAAENEQRMFDVERPAALERPVVETGDVGAVPRDEPGGQCVASAKATRAVCGEPPAHR